MEYFFYSWAKQILGQIGGCASGPRICAARATTSGSTRSTIMSPHFYLCVPPEGTEIVELTSVIGTTIRFTCHCLAPCPCALFCTVALACSACRALLLSLSTPPSFSFLASFVRVRELPLMGSQAQGVGRVAQGLPQTTVEMLNVPAQALLPGTGQTEEVLHPILSKTHWKQRLSWACVPKTWGIAVKLPVHGAYAEACTGTAAWQM